MRLYDIIDIHYTRDYFQTHNRKQDISVYILITTDTKHSGSNYEFQILVTIHLTNAILILLQIQNILQYLYKDKCKKYSSINKNEMQIDFYYKE